MEKLHSHSVLQHKRGEIRKVNVLDSRHILCCCDCAVSSNERCNFALGKCFLPNIDRHLLELRVSYLKRQNSSLEKCKPISADNVYLSYFRVVNVQCFILSCIYKTRAV